MSIKVINHIASTKFVNPFHDISRPQTSAASLPSSLLSTRWICPIEKENSCKTQHPVKQGAVAVAPSANPLLFRPLTGRYWLKIFLHKLGSLGLRILPLAPLWPAAPPLPVAKKSRYVKKSWCWNKDLGAKKVKHNFWGRCQELVGPLFRLILQIKWRKWRMGERKRER